MNDFTASDGAEIRITPMGGLRVQKPGLRGVVRIHQLEVDTLREFFRAEDDERLGRWRSVANPAWTAVVSDNPKGAVVFRHEDGERGFMVCDRDESLTRWTSELQAVAREYFDAHPEPKPWHDAKPGEVWLLTSPHISPDPAPYVAGDYTFLCADHGIPKDSDGITAGRRIWPEVSS